MGANWRDPVAGALFGKTRRNVLALLFSEPNDRLFLREIVRRTGSGQGAVQRELRNLTAGGIILREGIGRTITYRPNPDSPVHGELRSILAKTAGVVESLGSALAPVRDRIEVAFIFGSYAKGAAIGQASDIDVMVVGNVGFGEVVGATASFQRRQRREVNPTVYTPAEFARRARADHHLIGDVLRHPKLFVIGGQGDLDRLAEVGVGKRSPADARRDSRAPRRGRS